MLFSKTGVLFLPFLTIAFSIVMAFALKRTYETQKISLPGIAIWIAVFFASFIIVFILLIVSIFGILYFYY